MKKLILALFTFLCSAGLQAGAMTDQERDFLLAREIYTAVPEPRNIDPIIRETGHDSSAIRAQRREERKTKFFETDTNSCQRARLALLLAAKTDSRFPGIINPQGITELVGALRANINQHLRLIQNINDTDAIFVKEFPETDAVLQQLRAINPDYINHVKPILYPESHFKQLLLSEISQLYPQSHEQTNTQIIDGILDSITPKAHHLAGSRSDKLPLGLTAFYYTEARQKIQNQGKRAKKELASIISSSDHEFRYLTEAERSHILEQLEQNASELAFTLNGIGQFTFSRDQLKAFLKKEKIDIDSKIKLGKEAETKRLEAELQMLQAQESAHRAEAEAAREAEEAAREAEAAQTEQTLLVELQRLFPNVEHWLKGQHPDHPSNLKSHFGLIAMENKKEFLEALQTAQNDEAKKQLVQTKLPDHTFRLLEGYEEQGKQRADHLNQIEQARQEVVQKIKSTFPRLSEEEIQTFSRQINAEMARDALKSCSTTEEIKIAMERDHYGSFGSHSEQLRKKIKDYSSEEESSAPSAPQTDSSNTQQTQSSNDASAQKRRREESVAQNQKDNDRRAAQQKAQEEREATEKQAKSWSNNKLTHPYTIIAAGLGISSCAFIRYYRDEYVQYQTDKEIAESENKQFPSFSTYFLKRLATTFKVSKAVGVAASCVAAYGVYKCLKA